MNRTLGFAALGFVAAVVASCNPIGPRVCTQIGCDSGLAVVLQGTPATPFTIRATSSSATESIVCGESGGCSLFFEDFTPSQVTISYESGDETVQQTYNPTYSSSRPNGEGCPPECLQATVTLVLP